MIPTLVTPLPDSNDPEELSLRKELTDPDIAAGAGAALKLASVHIETSPNAARYLLQQATQGPPVTAARARLRLARLAQIADKSADVRKLLEEAHAVLGDAGQRHNAPDTERLAVLIDIGVAFGLVLQLQAAVGVLQGVTAELRALQEKYTRYNPATDDLRALSALASLRLGQLQVRSNKASANAALREAAALGTGSVAAAAALQRGWHLEHRMPASGPEIEEQYRMAADLGDPIISPMASISLGDLLWRNGNAESARAEWQRAETMGDAEIRERVDRRLDGSWSQRIAQDELPPPENPFDQARPRQGVQPPTPLGRVASGRAADVIDRRRPVIVVGAGTGGHYLLPVLQDYKVVGFVDDNPEIEKVGDVSVLGSISELEEKIVAHKAQQVLFAIPTATGSLRRRVLKAALRCRIEVRSLPSMFELRRAHPMVPQLRDIEVHETFGEFPWVIDRNAAGLVRGRRVAIVGAGSTVGRELARRVAHGQARHLLLLDEPPALLLKVAGDIREHRDFLDCDARIVDCADGFTLEGVMREFEPEIVFYCGGLSHVPESVLPARHAARANVRTALASASASRNSGARQFIMMSAARAASRACAFDMTKALAERAALQRMDTPPAPQITDASLTLVPNTAPEFRVSVLRLPHSWSREDTILERLTDQLADGGPIRVDPSARRCYVTPWQAAEGMLRLLAEPGEGGLFALTSGESVSVRQLAERLIWMNGLTSGVDIDIEEQPDGEVSPEAPMWGDGENGEGDAVACSTVRIKQDSQLIQDLDDRIEALTAGLANQSDEDLSMALAVGPSGSARERTA